jgi:predicted AlkP superfamily phosphohydrolase/phosphomutase
MSARLMILGLDGASWRLTQKLVADGRMPTIGRILAEGAGGPLYSTVPDVSPTAWASFMSGKNPGQHGVYGFGMKVPGSYFLEPFSSRGRIPVQSLWGALSSKGKRVAVINVPMTYPPEPVNGIMISGFGTPDDTGNRFVYPPELIDELRSKLGPYILDVHWNQYEKLGIPALLEANHQMTQRRAEYGLHILGRESWDLFMLAFVSTDRLQHCLWQYLEPTKPLSTEEQGIRNQVLDYYDYLDRVLADFLAASPDSNVMIMSDHGFGPCSAAVNVNTWLQEQGYLSWNKTNEALLHLRWLAKLVKSLGINRESFGRFAKLFGMNEYRHLEKLSHRSNNMDWDKTRAFSYTPSGIYLNLKGRERRGIVEPGAEAERLMDEIKERLEDLKDPATGQRVIHRVARGHEVYSGPRVELAPDLMIAEADTRYMCNFNLYRTKAVFEQTSWRSGNHEPEGLVLACGPGIAPKRRIERADLVDLCPTALHLLGEPVPDDIDGRVISEMLVGTERVKSVAASESQHVDTGSVMSAEEQAQVFERLKGLGYIE